MAIQTMALDPNAASYTDDQIVGKINTASAQITRASSVATAARPIASEEVTATEIATGAIKTKLGAESDGNKLVAASLATGAAITGSQLSASAAIVGTQLSASAAIAGTQLAAAANIAGTQLATTAAMDNLDAQDDTARKYIKTAPTTSQFKVISIQRAADGKAELKYDDVAV